MSRIGFGSQGMIRFGASCSQDDQPLAGFEELAMPLFDSLYNFASWLVHNQSNAEDLVQETYLKALRGFASFQPGTNFRAWMFRILRNTFLSSRSTLDRRMTVEIDSEDDDPVLPATSTTPESLLIERYKQNAVRNAIEQLPVTFREVLLLCDVEDASYREISDILSIPILRTRHTFSQYTAWAISLCLKPFLAHFLRWVLPEPLPHQSTEVAHSPCSLPLEHKGFLFTRSKDSTSLGEDRLRLT
jgi:RNA polymerase sigma factor (sigma-70 family)